MSAAKTESLMSSGGVWFPSVTSDLAGKVDYFYFWILFASTVAFIAILAVLYFFIRKYRRSEQNLEASAQITHNNAIELAWTIIPTIIVMGIFYWGFRDYLKLTVPPAQAMEIRVVGKKWMWQFEYPNGMKTIGELVVPVNQPVRLLMSSEDVIHSFFLPTFRIKRDVVPNRYTRLWFEANREGVFQIFCTEYCGDGHSDMLAVVKVMSKEAYTQWLAQQNSGDDLPLDQLGQKVYTAKGCAACHSLDGTAKVGPSWKGIFGETQTFTDGSSGKVDENYIKQSINEPNAKVVKGYQPVMPAFKGLVSDREIDGIIAYIKTLK